jgi:exonuclease SbcC
VRLQRLRCENFRQHADTEIVFRPGLTGIIGPNGAGKSTLLEAIAWAIYGARAARGTVDTLRFNKAEAGAPVRVELEFWLDEQLYTVARTLKDADLLLGPDRRPIASGAAAVTEALTRHLGMTREEFFHTYFTGQKELQFLAEMRPAERAQFLSQVLGYERLRAARDRARERARTLRAEIHGIESTLADPEALAREVEAFEAAAAEAAERAKEAEAELEAATRALAEAEPRWREMEARRERAAELAREAEWAEKEAADAAAEADACVREMGALADAERRLAGLRRHLERLPDVEREAQELAALREAEVTRQGLLRHLKDVEAAVRRRVAEAKRLEALAAARAAAAQRAAQLRTEREALEGERDRIRAEWEREKGEAETRLRTLRAQAQELRQQIRALEAAGPDGACPTCRRPLRDGFDRVMELLRGQLENLAQEGTWWKKRADELRAEPEALRQAARRLAQVDRELQDAEKALAQAQAAAERWEELRREIAEQTRRVRALRKDLASLPTGYDAERHRALEEIRRNLHRQADEAARLEARLEGRPNLEARRARAMERRAAAEGRAASARHALAELRYDADAHEAARAALERARSARERAVGLAERARAEAEAARARAEDARRRLEEQRRRVEELHGRRAAARLHEELATALDHLRTELNDRVRPELSEIAGAFLAELTDGRYDELEIDESYELVVLDGGVRKPVLSGGEEDVANLVLRLAISQLIAERAGRTLNLLIFDEIFGGLDETRRDNVLRLLQRLQDRFAQVILISHIESIRDGCDYVLRVEYDERTGTSTVREERPETPTDALEPAAAG